MGKRMYREISEDDSEEVYVPQKSTLEKPAVSASTVQSKVKVA